MSITALASVAIITAIICVLIKQYKPEYTPVISIAFGVLLLVLLMPRFSDVLEYIESILKVGKIDTAYGKVVVKALGICIITQLASDTCKDCGQSSMASKVELGGKVSILVVTLPVFASLIETIQKLINS